MAEATHPTPGVEHSEASILKRLGAVLEVSEDPAEEPLQRRAPEPQSQATSEPAEATPAPEPTAQDEPTADDIPDEEAPAAAVEGADFIEIVHDGAQVKLSREDAIRYARQGFDYTVKTQALAEKAKGVEAALQRAAEVEQLAPLIAGEQAQLIALRAQLEPYRNVDWIYQAANNPDYSVHKATYDALVAAHDQVAARVDRASNIYTQAKRQLTAQQLQQEFVRLPEFVPEWRNQARYEADSKEAFEWLTSKGVDLDRASKKLDDAFSCAVVYMAMKYDKLLKSKGEKSKLLQSAPPVTRPGVPNTPSSAQDSKAREARARFRKSGTIEDGAAFLVSRMK